MVDAAKFIRAIPRTRFLDTKRKTGWIIKIDVFGKAEPMKPINGSNS